MEKFSRKIILIFLVIFMFISNSSLTIFAQTSDSEIAKKYLINGETAFKKGDVKTAQKFFMAAQKADPKFDKPYIKLAELNLYYQNRKRAIEVYKEAVKNIPEDPSLYLRLGSIYYEDKQYDEAIENLNLAKKLAPGAPKIYLYLGLCYTDKTEYDTALENFNVFLEITGIEEEDKILAQKTLGDIYMEKKDWPNAAKYYKLVVDNPSSSQAMKLSAESGYKRATTQTAAPKRGLIYGVILIVAFILLYFAWGFIKKQQNIPDAGKKPLRSIKECATYEELGKFSSESLTSLTRLPNSLIYFVRRENAPLFMANAQNIDGASFGEMETNWEDLSNWLTRNQGKPFVYKTEIKDGLFGRAFPDSAAKLSKCEPRVGIPFISGNKFRGIGFMASPKVKDMAGLKRFYEKNIDAIFRQGIEIGEQAEKIFQKESAIKDSITPAFNQFHFRERLPKEIAKYRDSRRSLTLFIFEIDKMIAILKRFGEERKNYVLKTLVTSIQAHLSEPVDSIYRISDYSFAVIMGGANKKKAVEKAGKILEVISETRFSAPIPSVTASAGLAIFPDQGADAGELEAEAQKALEKALVSGRNKMVVGDETIEAKGVGGAETLLKQAMTTITIPKDDEVQLDYQIKSVKSAGEADSFKTNVATPSKKASEEVVSAGIIEPKTNIPIADIKSQKMESPTDRASAAFKAEATTISGAFSSGPDSESGSPTDSLGQKPPKQITFRPAQKTEPTAGKGQTGLEDLGIVPVEEVTHKKYKKNISSKVKEEITRARSKGGDSGRLILRKNQAKENEPEVEAPEPEKPSVKAVPPPWFKDDKSKPTGRKDDREISDTSLLRRPPKMREVGSSTSSLPPLPKSAEVKRPMSGLIRRSKSSVQVPGVKRRTITAALRPLDTMKQELAPPPEPEIIPEEIVEPKPTVKAGPVDNKTVEVPIPKGSKPEIKKPSQGLGYQKIEIKPLPKKIPEKEPVKEEVKEPEKKPVITPKISIKPIKNIMPRTFTLDTSSLARPGKRPSRTDTTTTRPMGPIPEQIPNQQQATAKEIPTDPVTGFYYKPLFEQSLKRLSLRANQTQRPLALLFMKLDKHKLFKTKYGDEKLNNVLKEIAQTIGSFIKEDSDIPCRYSEEIFVFILPDTSFQIAFNLAEQIRFTVVNLSFKDIPGPITMSLGVSSFPAKGKTPKDLMKTAYDAMVYAIKSGGNKSLIWDNELVGK